MALMALLVLPAGCTRGLLFSHTIEPLDTNMHRTQVAGARNEGNVKHLAIRGITVEWGNEAIAEIARKNGIKTLYFADRETLKIFTFWRTTTIHVYGQ
jgi:hypothetical protein